MTKIPAINATGAISGKVFNDSNSNGVKDAGELPLANAVVYIDYDNDSKNYQSARATTDAAGNYSFPGLADGPHYRIRVAPPEGFRKSKPASGTPGYDITVTNGNSFAGKDFGVTEQHLDRRDSVQKHEQ